MRTAISDLTASEALLIQTSASVPHYQVPAPALVLDVSVGASEASPQTTWYIVGAECVAPRSILSAASQRRLRVT